jgi:hypothetical protein
MRRLQPTATSWSGFGAFQPLRSASSAPEGRNLTQSGHCGKHHSITSSARASNSGGTVRPSILADLTLITSSNLVLC